MDKLLKKLSENEHTVKFEERIDDYNVIKQRIKGGLIFLTYIETHDATELGLNLDKGNCDFDTADFENRCGQIHIEGECMLNFVSIRIIADINLATRIGKARMVCEVA